MKSKAAKDCGRSKEILERRILLGDGYGFRQIFRSSKPRQTDENGTEKLKLIRRYPTIETHSELRCNKKRMGGASQGGPINRTFYSSMI